MGVHERLQALLLAHQLAVLDRDGVQAQAHWRAFAGELEAHIAIEEAHVLPLYVRAGGDATDSPSAQFVLEHRKLRAFLQELGTRAAGWPARIAAEEALAVLERETTLKSLLLHHDLREGRVLYPLLTRMIPEAERRALSARLSSAGGRS